MLLTPTRILPPMYEEAALFRPAPVEPTLDEELRSLGEEPAEMTNLQEEDTGVPGTVLISTAMGAHGPRVKYYLRPGRSQPSFSVSIAEEPRLLTSSLPVRDTRRATPVVIDWVRLNHDALLRFWREGDTWTARQVAAFLAALERI